VISRNSSRPLSDIEGGIVDILRLGVYQLLRMRVPDHAAVSQTVDLARQYLSAGPAKFINAVLRSVIREGEESRQEALNELPESEKEYDRNTSLETIKLILKLGYTITPPEK